MNTVELASRILTQLGFYQEPSREIGIDCRRDNIVHLIEEYTHPAKTLTDEEILQEAENMFGTHFFECIDDPYWIEFARAILRKAQEK